MPVHYYVWYEVAGDPAPARIAVAALMDEVARATGVAGRLLARRDRPATWMEIYEDVADAARFESELAGAVRRLEVEARTGARHVEAFVAAD